MSNKSLPDGVRVDNPAPVNEEDDETLLVRTAFKLSTPLLT